jgi:hypothetical protein
MFSTTEPFYQRGELDLGELDLIVCFQDLGPGLIRSRRSLQLWEAEWISFDVKDSIN